MEIGPRLASVRLAVQSANTPAVKCVQITKKQILASLQGGEEGGRWREPEEKTLPRVKVGTSQSTSGPPLTMETRLELNQCSSLSGEKHERGKRKN